MLRVASHGMRRCLRNGFVGQDEGVFGAAARYARAQNVVEYGILIATIVMVVLLCVSAFGSEIKPWFAQLAGHITTVGT
jgi:Flp pilus assembly pilin Flp